MSDERHQARKEEESDLFIIPSHQHNGNVGSDVISYSASSKIFAKLNPGSARREGRNLPPVSPPAGNYQTLQVKQTAKRNKPGRFRGFSRLLGQRRHDDVSSPTETHSEDRRTKEGNRGANQRTQTN